jgi:hypothetical protein
MDIILPGFTRGPMPGFQEIRLKAVQVEMPWPERPNRDAS